RRHTRSKRDWSSDVCSSDLESYRLHFASDFESAWSNVKENSPNAIILTIAVDEQNFGEALGWLETMKNIAPVLVLSPAEDLRFRSEERRVGKECSCRGLP